MADIYLTSPGSDDAGGKGEEGCCVMFQARVAAIRLEYKAEEWDLDRRRGDREVQDNGTAEKQSPHHRGWYSMTETECPMAVLP